MPKKRFKKRYILILLTIIIVGGVIFVASRPKPSGIETAIAEPATVTNVVSVTGNVEPVAQANFGFQIGGVVKSIPVTVGEQVKAGDLIASLNDQTIRASLL